MEVILTIITPAFNSGILLERCLKSVDECFNSQIEHLIIYKTSTDNTLEICQKFGRRVIHQENDGIYDAMNLGASIASGKFLLYLSSNDHLDVNQFCRLRDLLPQLSTESLHVFGIFMHSGSSTERQWNPSITKSVRLFRMPFPHPGLLIPRVIQLKLPYSVRFKSSADYEFLLRVLLDGSINITSYPLLIVHFYIGGASSTLNAVRENFRIRRVSRLTVMSQLFGLFYDIYTFARSSWYKLVKIFHRP